jgi:hypothetical protein
MLSGDRSNEPATLGVFGAISALVLCCFIVGILAYSSGQETQRRDQTPAAYSEAAKRKAQEDCAGREGNAAFECIYEKVEASQQQSREEQDLTAQQKSANGTMITAALAFLGLIASVVGIGLVYTTFNETRKANDIALLAQRPWLKIDIEATLVGTFEKQVSLGFSANVENIGASVAQNVRFYCYLSFWGPTSKAESERFFANYKDFPSAFKNTRAILPKGSTRYGTGVNRPIGEIPQWDQKPKGTYAPMLLVAASYGPDDQPHLHMTGVSFSMWKLVDSENGTMFQTGPIKAIKSDIHVREEQHSCIR